MPRSRAEGRAGVLLLCHRIPYPPDKGDKIRSYHWLVGLAERYDVYLGAFVDDPADWVHVGHLRTICCEAFLCPLGRLRSRLRALAALLVSTPLSVAAYRDRKMSTWVGELLKRRALSGIVVFSSAMAQYARMTESSECRRVIDYVDVDADKWRQYAKRSGAPLSWVYAREAKTLFSHDAQVADLFDASIFVSRQEVELFRRLGARVDASAVSNGVDHSYFAPSMHRATPFLSGEQAVVFTGAMDYWANADAVCWFVDQVWPAVRQRAPRARFYIVGGRPGSATLALVSGDVVVTGRVGDVRPYLQHAAAVVAPMRIARGVQNKVLEGMAMGRVVVTTSMGLEGIDAVPGRHLLSADDAGGMAEVISAVLEGRYSGLGAAARAFVCASYDWRVATQRFLSIVAGENDSELAQS